jgi:hypothetical protein
VDGNGNVFITGYFEGTSNFGTTLVVSVGASDIFVAKYDPVGISWSWVRSSGATSYDSGNGIAVDVSGNVFVTGAFEGTVNFGTISVTSAGSSDAFITKYSNSGSVKWVQTVHGSSSSQGNSIAIDSNENVFLTGAFGGTVNFDAVQKSAVGSWDIFVAKYNKFGTFQWSQIAGGTGFDNVEGTIYLVGNFQGTAKFGAVSKMSVGSDDIFVARIQE